MKIQELRIGNLVKCKTSNDSAIYSVIQIDGLGLKVRLSHPRHTEFTPLDRIKPIPLTEEILLKCGFYQENGVMSYATQDYSSVKITYETLAKYYRLYPYTYRIDYLHQLQNLYFDLTGEELEVKL